MATPTGSVYNRAQQDIDTARAALETQIAEMVKAGNTVQQIHDDVRLSYVAASSSIFSSKLQEWMQAYTNIKQAVDHLHQALTDADQIQNTGEMSAAEYAGAWANTGDSFYQALT
ncbi:hypothetical protein AB0E75_10525 [Streptomyces griseoviridis]|uniref:WXG100 family type VII secretion target n=3 Tax=Streptomyces TaxID=1883 RepID=A0A918LFH2_STRGD|nr:MULTISPECIES: hypothetical protein [Streptomyces]MDP9685228.1 uncharacterized protein YukE [Streptomyces griseoviridis]GGS41703.1 hypothetical protein GCM10010238_34110 [Streptomyces niveoruber]GGS95703.1 hypothetical protein GCM10010240_31290 [Streptomyces griseoviridis]GGU31950.1 hypothetical protein GCM10010259_23060 [Streptomyces daghestanicus]GHI32828.1 hypothetical protein Sdagh_45580 [Streptomyces daghestanicus]